jgi:hypothetical protein
VASPLARFGMFEAGKSSARDPRYPVEPRRARQATGTAETRPRPAGHAAKLAAQGRRERNRLTRERSLLLQDPFTVLRDAAAGMQDPSERR